MVQKPVAVITSTFHPLALADTTSAIPFSHSITKHNQARIPRAIHPTKLSTQQSITLSRP